MSRAKDAVENVLAHYGVKGMQWGVRRQETSGSVLTKTPFKKGDLTKDVIGRPATVTKAKTLSKKDAEELRQTLGVKDLTGLSAQKVKYKTVDKVPPSFLVESAVKAVNKDSIRELKRSLKDIKNSPDFKGKKLSKLADDHPDKVKYNKEVTKKFDEIYTRRYQEALARKTKWGPHAKVSTKRATGAFILDTYGGFYYYGFDSLLPEKYDLRHASADENYYEIALFRAKIEYTEDEEGFVMIDDDSSPELMIADYSSAAEDILAHHGIKGMRWGVRRSDAQLARARVANANGDIVDAVVNTRTRTAMAVSPEARGRESSEMIIKKYGLSPLTNKEIQDYVTRVNLERQFANLNTIPPSRTARATKFATSLVKDVAKEPVMKLARTQTNIMIRDQLKARGKLETADRFLPPLGEGKKKKKD